MALAEGEEGQGGSRPLKWGSVLAALVVVSGLGRAGCGRQEGSGAWGVWFAEWPARGRGKVCDAQAHRREGPGPEGCGGLGPRT